jgi:hypothetical protein
MPADPDHPWVSTGKEVGVQKPGYADIPWFLPDIAWL